MQIDKSSMKSLLHCKYRGFVGLIAVMVPLMVATGFDAQSKSAQEKIQYAHLLSPEMLGVDINGLGQSLQKRVAPSYPFSVDGMMFLNGEPERLCCSFDKEALPKWVNYDQRQIIVYPIKQYRELFTKAKQLNEFDKRVTFMKKALNTGKVGAGEISVFPSVDACQLFRAKVQFLDFKGGRGVRFISRYCTDVSPTTADSIFYTFQGMTANQKYWVSVFFPLRADGLKATTDASISKRLLDSRSPNQFKPDLNKLDALVRSISIF
jgi:hypothetical protein